MEEYNNMQADLNKSSTEIDKMKISNSEINYFIIDGVKYGNRKLSSTNKFVKVLVEGKASVYLWSGNVTFAHTESDREAKMKGHVFKETTYQKQGLPPTLQMVLKGTVYSANAKYIKKNCPDLCSATAQACYRKQRLIAISITPILKR